MSKKLLTSITVLALLLSTMSFAVFAETEVTTDGTEEPTEAVESTEESTEEPADETTEESEEAVEPVLSYLTFDLDEEITFVVEDGIVVDVVTNTTEEIIEEPADETTEEPADETTEEPADETTEEPADETTEEPADETTEEPADETTEEPADETTEEPADETTEEPAEETTEEPADETTEEPADETTEEPIVDEEVAEEILSAPFAAYIGLPVVDAVGTFIEENEITEAIEVQILGNESMIEELENTLNESFEELLDVDTIALDSDNPNAERFVNAAKLQITNGKMNLLEKLKASANTEDFDYSEWSDLSVKEIMASVKANKKDAKFNVESDDSDDTEEVEDADEEKVEVKKSSPSKSNKGKAKGKK